jgi:hypothetical protein
MLPKLHMDFLNGMLLPFLGYGYAGSEFVQCLYCSGIERIALPPSAIEQGADGRE